MTTQPDAARGDNDDADESDVSRRDKSHESTPTKSGHSTADGQARRNQEDESPS